MKKFLLLIFTSLCTTYMSAQEQINLLDITSGKYAPKRIQEMTSSADGESYYQANKDNTMIIKYAYKTGLPTDTVFNVKRARECPFDSFQGFIIAPDDKRILLFNEYEPIYRHSFKATYYYFDMRRNLVQKLTTNKDKQSVPTFSHDGRMLAYVIDNNIWLAKFDYDSESQVTKDGEPGKIINGATDWVYEEEFGTTSIMDFSADNRLLAFLKTDETDVTEFSFQKYDNQLYPELFSFKYPKAGLPNSKVSVNVFDIEAKTTRKMDIPKCEYIPQLQFLPEGDNMAVITLNREQNDLNIYLTNGRSSVSKLLLNEKNDSYVDFELARNIQFVGDQFVYLSEKDGYNHIYLYSNTGVLDKQLTSGNYDVTAILAVDPTTNTIFYEAADESPLRRNVYKMDLKKAKNGTTKLSSKSGYNTAQFSNNGKYFVNYYTNATTPTYITVNDASGKELRVLENNDALKKRASQVGVTPKEFITVKAADGTTDLNAYLMKPANFNPSQKYPLVMVQYSGPNSQMVEDKFIIDWTDYLVSQGFIVACVDGRGTGARGEDFRKSTYMNLGIKESDDQIAAAKYFGTLPYIDKDKIAIWGWSYGGYNTLMSMSRGNVFAAGIAIAPVTDWRYYDTVYAERFMRTPQQNASGFDNGSPIKLANQLNGNLLLVHGSADDNVHFQNSLEYANALVKANKQFDMFVFTDKDHSIRGAANRAYLYNKIIKYLETNM